MIASSPFASLKSAHIVLTGISLFFLTACGGSGTEPLSGSAAPVQLVVAPSPNAPSTGQGATTENPAAPSVPTLTPEVAAPEATTPDQTTPGQTTAIAPPTAITPEAAVTPQAAAPKITAIALNLREQNSGASWSYAALPSDTRRYEVRKGDLWSGDKAAGNERSESYSNYHTLDRQTYQISFKMMIEAGAKNQAPWLVLSQLTSVLDKGEASHSPPFALELNKERLRVVTRDSAVALSTAQTTRYMRLYEDTKDIERGKWYDLKIEILFDPAGAGSLKLWRDNVLIVDYAGPLGFNDQVGPYFKQGIYRAPSEGALAINFKDLKMGIVQK